MSDKDKLSVPDSGFKETLSGANKPRTIPTPDPGVVRTFTPSKNAGGPVLSEERKGQIALAMMKHQVRQKGIPSLEARREFPNFAKSTGIPIEEVKAFAEILAREYLEEFFRKE